MAKAAGELSDEDESCRQNHAALKKWAALKKCQIKTASNGRPEEDCWNKFMIHKSHSTDVNIIIGVLEKQAPC